MNQPNYLHFWNDVSQVFVFFFFRYTGNIKNLSTLMKKEKNPMDEAIGLLEYLSKTKGAEHLKLSSRHLNFVQYYSLDFFALIYIPLCITLVIAFWILLSYISRKIFYFIHRLCKTKTAWNIRNIGSWLFFVFPPFLQKSLHSLLN